MLKMLSVILVIPFLGLYCIIETQEAIKIQVVVGAEWIFPPLLFVLYPSDGRQCTVVSHYKHTIDDSVLYLDRVNDVLCRHVIIGGKRKQ